MNNLDSRLEFGQFFQINATSRNALSGPGTKSVGVASESQDLAGSLELGEIIEQDTDWFDGELQAIEFETFETNFN